MAKPKGQREQGIVPIDQLVDMLDEFGDGFLETEEGQAFGRLMNVLEAKAVELAPKDTGNLEDSTVVRVEHRGSKLVGVLRFAAEYASYAHECISSPWRSGEKTRAKPGNEYGMAGPKFLERPLRGFVKELGDGMKEALQKYWTGQSGKGKRRGKRRKK